jgi:hypothetical protein
MKSPDRTRTLFARRVNFRQHHDATEFFSVVLADNDFITRIEHARQYTPRLLGPQRNFASQ